METIHAFAREDSGLLTPCELVYEQDGGQVMTQRGFPLQDTGRTETLVNWGESSGERPIYQSEHGGREYVVVLPQYAPTKHPEGCSCGNPDCPQFMATQGVTVGRA